VTSTYVARQNISLSSVSVLGSRLRWAAPAGLIALMVSYAVLIPAGLPYDEPSHWQNVRYIARHGALPVLGSPQTSYEAQMGPVAYVIDAVIFRVGILAGLSDAHAFIAVRLSGILWLVTFGLLTYRIVRRCLPTLPPVICATGTAISTMNPVVMAVGMSIQNDLPALTLAALAIDLFSRSTSLSLSQVYVVGLIAGAAVLTKLTVWPVALVIGALLLVRRRNADGVRKFLLFGMASGMVLGWWIARNLILYGDLTGQAGVAALGTKFPPEGWRGAATFSGFAQSAATFLWLPVEYWRNTISAPALIQIVVIGCTLAIGAAGAMPAWRLRAPSSALVITIAAVAVLTWSIVDTWSQGASFRIAYLVLPLWACICAGALSRLPRMMSAMTTALVLLGLHSWVLIAVIRAGNPSVMGP
jgi:hypothetical protein